MNEMPLSCGYQNFMEGNSGLRGGSRARLLILHIPCLALYRRRVLILLSGQAISVTTTRKGSQRDGVSLNE